MAITIWANDNMRHCNELRGVSRLTRFCIAVHSGQSTTETPPLPTLAIWQIWIHKQNARGSFNGSPLNSNKRNIIIFCPLFFRFRLPLSSKTTQSCLPKTPPAFEDTTPSRTHRSRMLNTLFMLSLILPFCCIRCILIFQQMIIDSGTTRRVDWRSLCYLP